MGHLHRQLMAQQAIQADKETCRTCEPVLPDAPAESRVAKPQARRAAKKKVARSGKA